MKKDFLMDYLSPILQSYSYDVESGFAASDSGFNDLDFDLREEE